MKVLRSTLVLGVVSGMLLATAAFAETGAETFKAKCAMCHGADGSKAMPSMGVKPLTSEEVQKQSDAELTAAITKGKGKMPAYAGKLTDAQIKDLVAHIRTLKK